jgi:hypothetical protein
MDKERMDERALNDLFDDLAAGVPPSGREGLDADVISDIAELRSLAEFPLPQQSRKRVDAVVEAAIARMERNNGWREHQMSSTTMSRSPNGRHSSYQANIERVTPSSAAAARWRLPALSWLGTAALFALLLGLGYSAFLRDPAKPGAPSGGNLFAPSLQEASPEAMAEDVVVEFAFPDLVLPAGEIAAWTEFYEILPNQGGKYTITGKC